MTGILLAGALLTAGPGPLRSESAERTAFKNEVRGLLRQRDFPKLESLAADLVKKDPRYACGVSKLVDFYVALEPADTPGSDDAQFAVFTAWAQLRPNSYIPKVGFALVEHWRAGEARGSKWAHETSPEQWREHDRHAQLALDWGRKALADKPRDPELYAQLIGLCRGADCSQSQSEDWLASALAINPNYDAVYIQMANFLLPRWRGSPEDFTEFAKRASDANEKLGNIVYARIATVGLLIEDDFRSTYPDFEWKRILAGLDEIDRRYPDSNRTYHLMARFALAYKDREVAHDAMSRLTESWDADASQYWPFQGLYSAARRWALQPVATGRVRG